MKPVNLLREGGGSKAYAENGSVKRMRVIICRRGRDEQLGARGGWAEQRDKRMMRGI